MEIAKTWAVDKKVVDIGCSIGVGSIILSRYAREVWGIDINQEAVGFANLVFSVPKLSFAVLDVEDSRGRTLPTFDVIVAVELLEHLADYRAGLATLKRFFAPDGHSLGFVSVPNIEDEQTRLRDMKNPLHLHRWRANEFLKLLAGEFRSVELYQESPIIMAKVAGAK